MRRERTTLVGTPTVIAPGAIFLVGEFGLPEEEVAVLAALSSYATAQYFPDASPFSPLVAAVVERAKTHLGEAAAALPAGSVLLSTAKAPVGGERFVFDTTPAIAVATAAAVFETAGQSISEQRDEILAVAGAGHRAVHEGIAAEGELAAALHGGLVKVVTQAVEAPRVEALAAPAGLHLVVFQAGHALFPEGWLSSVRQFAEHNRIAYARIANELFEQASRFVKGLSEGNATAAIASAGRYGHCITQLADAASAPLQSGLFLRAMELAREIGGIAKTTNPDRGGLGVAMFATPEAASLFSHACQPAVLPFAVELDRAGVRCLVPAAVQTPAPETGPSSISAEAIVRDSIDERTTEKTLPEAESAPEKVDPQGAGQPSGKRRGLGPVIGGLLLVAGLFAGWLTNSLGVHSAPQVKTPDHAAALKASALPAHGDAAPAAPAGVEHVSAPSRPAVQVVAHSSKPQPLSAKSHALASRSHALKSGKAQKPAAAAPPIQVMSGPKPAPPAASQEPPKPSAPRAGKLSNDDF
jgi:mevalonate kinase